MPDVDDLAKIGRDTRKSTVPKLACYRGKSLDLEEALNLILGVSMRRVADTETIVGERVVAGCKCISYIRVVVSFETVSERKEQKIGYTTYALYERSQYVLSKPIPCVKI